MKPCALSPYLVQECQARDGNRDPGDGVELGVGALDLLAACAAHSPWAAAAVILSPGASQALASALLPQTSAAYAAAGQAGSMDCGTGMSAGECRLCAAAIRVLKVCSGRNCPSTQH